MRTPRFLLAALAVALVAACTSEPSGIVPPESPSFDGVGFSGSGNAFASDSISSLEEERCGAGFCGSGN